MNTEKLITAVSESTGLPKTDVRLTVVAISEIVKSELKAGNDVTLYGIGRIYAVQGKARSGLIGMGPKKGERIDIPARMCVKFRPKSALKLAVRGG